MHKAHIFYKVYVNFATFICDFFSFFVFFFILQKSLECYNSKRVCLRLRFRRKNVVALYDGDFIVDGF